MKGAGAPSLLLVVALGAGAALGGCRAVLGIDSLDLVDGGADSSTAGADGAAPDVGQTAADTGAPDVSAAEAAPVESGSGDASDAAAAADVTDASPYFDCIQRGSDCRPCCKNTYRSQDMQWEMSLAALGCVCGSGQCVSQCASSLCAAPPPPPPTAECAMCVDMATLARAGLSPQCEEAVTNCQNTTSCADVVDCLRACP